MRNIVNIIGIAMLVLYAAGRAQSPAPGKCTTFDRFRTGLPPGISAKVTEERPDLQTSILSPRKHFRIHFDTTGINTPAFVTAQGARIEGTARQFADTTAKIFDSVWTAEIGTIGFAAPPSDLGLGGGDEYDVYILDRGANNFGETMWDPNAPLSSTTAAPRFASYINIDNDFGSGFRTMGLAGVMSTAAHEFHHAIQIGGYGIWYSDLYFYELSAESMEPTVFPVSKDYINDVGTYFRNIDNISLYTSNATYSGYERAIWGVFLMRRYGTGIMREIWEAVAAAKPVPAMKTALEKRGTSLTKEFSEFCFWNYYTGWRADTTRFYADAHLFPVVAMRARETLHTQPITFQYACRGFGVNYLEVQNPPDTAAFIVANTNMDDALGAQSGQYGYQVRVSAGAGNGGTQLSNGMYADFTVSDPGNWKYLPLAGQAPASVSAAACFPNPFNPSTSSLYISLTREQALQTTRTLNVYSASYDCVYSGSVPRQSFNGAQYAVWDGKTSQGGLCATGVYLYVLTSGGTTMKGKFAVIR